MIYSKWTVGAMPPEAEAVRRKVFVEELGDPETSQFDGKDAQAWHLVVWEEDVPVAAGRITLDEAYDWQLGKIAVLPQARGRFVGDFVIRLMVDRILSSMPPAKIYGDVPLKALARFAAVGFVPEGEPTDRSGHPYQRMVFPEGARLVGSCGGHK